jgi:hypothetical protein
MLLAASSIARRCRTLARSRRILIPRHPLAAAGAACLVVIAGLAPASAGPQLDLSERLLVDGFSAEFDSTEALFGINETYVKNGIPCVVGGVPPCPAEEGVQDSQWGYFNDINQIKVTWDAKNLYVAVDGITWGNNVMLFFDTTRHNRTDFGPGLPDMVNVNSWRRNISFANGFAPDFFLATWDGNQTPQAWTYLNRRTVTQVSASAFKTAASFSGNAEGRALEAAIPWRILLQRDSTFVSAAYNDPVPVLPAGVDTLRLAACITAGGDGTGSPDSAPDNFSGHQVDGNAPATVDNFIMLPLDLQDAAGLPNPDGVPDMPGAGQVFIVDPFARHSFLARPPIKGIAFSLADIHITRGVVVPERGLPLEFAVTLDQTLGEDEAGRSVSVSAEVYDLHGVRRRTIYLQRRVAVLDLQASVDTWDGRDDGGRFVEGGIYVLRVVLEPGQDQVRRSFTVVR